MSLINKLLDKITDYARLKGEKIKLDLIAIIAKILAQFISVLMVGVVVLFLLTFLSFALGAYLNARLESSFSGYLIVAAIYFICLVVIVLIWRSNRMQKWLESLFVKLGEGLNVAEDEE